MIKPTAITGIGVVTPAGIGLASSWENVLKGRGASAKDETLQGIPVEMSCRVPDFDADILNVSNPWQWDRFAQFALAATHEALNQAGLVAGEWADDSRVAVLIGSGAGGTASLEEQHQAMLEEGPDGVSPLTLPMGLLNMAAGQVAIELGARGTCVAPCTACAAGASAIGLGRDLIAMGRADIVIAGGTEAPITPFYVSAFARMRALSRNTDPATASRPFDVERDGFVIGEGAGIFVLESEQHAKARDAKILARVCGYGASADANHVTSPHPNGRGAMLAMQAAIADAGVSASEVGYVNAHGTSTPGNDVIESRAIQSVFGSDICVSSTKGVTGHLLGAAGPIESAFTVMALKTGQLPPTAGLITPDPHINVDLIQSVTRDRKVKYALSNSFGFGGQNASLLLSA